MKNFREFLKGPDSKKVLESLYKISTGSYAIKNDIIIIDVSGSMQLDN
jgi:hypothetical protein